MEPPWGGGTEVYINDPGHMTKMAATPIYGKNPSKSWSFTIHFYWHFSNSWSQIQKFGVKNSKFGVSESSVVQIMYESFQVQGNENLFT